MRILASCLAAFAFLVAGPIPASCAAETGRARVLVELPDGSTRAGCLGTDGDLSGLDALKEAGFRVTTKDFGPLGSAVCTIDGFGNDLDDCPGANGHWHYWHFTDGEWKEATTGPSQRRLAAGETDGWRWSPGSENEPPSAEPNEPCSPTTGAPRNEEPLGIGIAGWIAVGSAASLAAALIWRRR